MCRYVVFGLFVLVLMVQPVWAHPPTQIELSYDSGSQSLAIEGPHLVRNGNDHYIRKIDVYRNEQKIESVYFKRQMLPTHLKKSINVAAEPNDVIKVKVFCEKGGSREQSLTVPEIESEEEESIMDKDAAPSEDVKRLDDQDEHKGSQYR